MTLSIENKTLLFYSSDIIISGSVKQIVPEILKHVSKQQLKLALDQMEKKNHSVARFGVMHGEFLFTAEK